MPITFVNIIFDEILEKLSSIINNEFNIPVYYDEHKGNQSFLLIPDSDEIVTNISGGMQRQYNITIDYELKSGGSYTKNTIKQVSNIMERLKRLVYNEKIQSTGAEWFDAQITSVEYERDEDDQTLIKGKAIFNCQNMEII
tara:strand:+ start:2336 stop:2758 length:423 start_codon:yes stop_codon:yes gene_type:complete